MMHALCAMCASVIVLWTRKFLLEVLSAMHTFSCVYFHSFCPYIYINDAL